MSTVAILLLADFLAQPANFIDRCVSEDLGVDCSIRGVVQMRAVDPQRFLVAVDTEPSDGRVDHLFLFVSSPARTPSNVSEAEPTSGSVTVRYGQKEVEIQKRGEAPIVFNLELTTIAHYSGYGDSGGRLDVLDELQLADVCDGPIGICWEADGWNIFFPR
ncbi:MAG: hypothetical protein R3245_05470 [Kiloniellales bacterium]|nr:hypothetical protein [Kiloniellales bacterium]